MADEYQFRVVSADAGERLDRVLAAALRQQGHDVSNRAAKSLVEGGSVKVGGQTAERASTRVETGALVQVRTKGLPVTSVTELTDISPTVIYRDESILAINKPSGLPTHATHDLNRDHAQAAVRRFLGDGAYVAVHHRLDVDTSGVLLFAIARPANKGLADAFAERIASKTYLAATHGKPLAAAAFEVKNHLGGDRHSDAMVEVHSGGDFAHTSFEVRYRAGEAALVIARPVTGRTHQIRVHLAGVGSPIVGDLMYGGAPADRLMLHAARLELPHPVTGERLELVAPIPPQFARIARNFGLEVE